MLSNTRKGFTLIELLIVVVIIGILAAIAIPRFATTKEKAYIASMKSDLKNLATAQEACFADRTPNAYCGTGVIDAAPYSWAPSGGAAVTPIAVQGDATGWSASITDTRVSTAANDQCTIFSGSGAAANANKGAATQEGVPVCQ